MSVTSRDRWGRTPEQIAWMSMRQRCRNPSACGYELYGAKGVRVCERWDTFANFLADMGPRPPGTSLDRYPNRHGNYEPGNCRWATPAEQMQNRRDNVLTWDLVNEIRGRIEHGESHSSVARRLGLTRSHVSRVWRGERWKEPAV